MNIIRPWLDVICVVAGTANLLMYSFADHQPWSLGIGILCFFAAIWEGPRSAV